MSNVLQLSHYGQSAWLDYIDRNLLVNGGLEELMAAGIRGVTSNPTIFCRAITLSEDYDETIRDLIQGAPNIDAATLYEWLVIEDAQMAADLLYPVYESSRGIDGYMSIELSPHLAYDTASTIKAAQHLWKKVNRPNVLIKIPATLQGLPAIERLIAEGINVNATLLFSVLRYEQVADAYLQGLDMNTDPASLMSVASFFIGRIDRKVDAELKKIGTPEALRLKGKIAIATAKMAYRTFKRIFLANSFSEYRKRGARVQRLLWGSMSPQDPAYSQAMYVNALIGPNTISTLPTETLDAFQAYGELRAMLEDEVDEALREIESLSGLGIDLGQIAQSLEEEEVAGFTASYEKLLMALNEKRYAVTKDFAGR